MSKRKKNRRQGPRPPAPSESPTSKAVTVFWMTSLLATAMGQLAAAALGTIAVFAQADWLALLGRVMLLVAVTTAVVCLIVTPIVHRWRDTPPPRAITRFAIVVSLLPIIALIAVLIWQR